MRSVREIIDRRSFRVPEEASLERYRHARIIVLNGSASAADAALAMQTNQIGSVLVSGEGGVAGVVTDRDLALRVVAAGRDPRTTPLRDVMTSPVTVLDVNASHEEALEIMREGRLRRVPLVEGARVVGMLSFDDLLLERAATYDELVEIVQAQIIEGGPARTRRFDEWTSLLRRHARALGTKAKLLADVRDAAKLRSSAEAEQALEIVLAALAAAVDGDVRDRLLARLPLAFRGRLHSLLLHADRPTSRREIEALVAEELDIDAAGAADVVDAIGAVSTRFVRASDAVGRHLSRDLRRLLSDGRKQRKEQEHDHSA